MALRTVIVEDESASRDRLRRLLVGLGDQVRIVAEAENGPAAVEVIHDYEPDLVLLDISLPGFDGFEVVNALSVRPAIVFTTAHDEHAIRAFRANATDYLLKPVDPEQLAAAVAKVAISRSVVTARDWPSLPPPGRGAVPVLKRIACRVGDTMVLVALEDVCYFRADSGYTLVKTHDRELLVDTPLADLEAQLDRQDFVRIHRDSLVNLDFVELIKRTGDGRLRVVLKDGDELVSSRRYADNLRGLTQQRA